MHEYVCFTHFVQCALERFYQLCREFSDESYGIAEKKWTVFYDHLSYRSIQGRKELVFGENVAFREEVHQCTLADIGVSYQ